VDSGRIRSAATPAPGAPDEPGPRIARWGLAISIASGVAATVAQLVDFGVYGLRIRSLDMGTHASVFGALSLLALAGSIAAAFMLLLDLGRRTLWATALPLLLAALLALRVIHPAGVLLLALPLAVATFPILWWRVGSGDAEAQCVVRLGCVALVASYAIRAVAPTVDSAFGYCSSRGTVES